MPRSHSLPASRGWAQLKDADRFSRCALLRVSDAQAGSCESIPQVDDFMGKFQSWQAYYVPWQHFMLRNMPSWHRHAEEHVWGLDAMMDEYILGESTDFGDMDGYQVRSLDRN